MPRRDHSRWTNVIRASLVSSILAIAAVGVLGCTTPEALTDARIPVESPPAGAERLLSELPTATFSEQQALEARGALRDAVIEGASSSTDWLAVNEDGSFEATGILQEGGSWDGAGGEYILVGLKVPQVVGDVTVYHVVPLIFEAQAQVTNRGERYPIEAVMWPSEGELDIAGMYWATARFSVQDGWIRGESLTFTDQEVVWGAWPDDYPASADLDPWRLAADAAITSGVGTPWLDIESPEDAFDLAGYWTGWLSAEPGEQGFAGSFDVTVVDHLGSAAIYHVAQVFYEQQDDVPAGLLLMSSDASEPIKPQALAVRLVDDKLVVDGADR